MCGSIDKQTCFNFFFHFQIIREVDVALERSLRAEVVDLIESEDSQDSELELDKNQDLLKSNFGI